MGVAGAGVGIGRVDDAPIGGEVRVADAQIDYVGMDALFSPYPGMKMKFCSL